MFTANAPKIDDYLSAEAQDFFGKVTSGLDAAGVSWTRAAALVRGLDYYRHTAFEFVTDRLGAQGTVLGGGRYDGLMEALGGAATPAVGWAAGIERLAMLVTAPPPLKVAAIVIESDEARHLNLGSLMLRAMRRKDMPSAIFDTGAVRKRYDRAMKMHPDYIVILGRSDDENAVGSLTVKRFIHPRDRRKGRLNMSLRLLLKNLFGVDSAVWKEVVDNGGTLKLFPKSK